MYAVQAAIVFRMRGTAREMSGVFLASLIPTAALGPVAGVFADRWNARWTMIASDIARAALLAALVFARSLWQIYAVSFAVSCISAFFTPAFSITVPRLVEPEALLKANARLQQSMHAVRIASPAIAGALVAGVGAPACYWADSASFLISAALIATLPDWTSSCIARPGGRAPPRNIFRNMADGIGYAAVTAGLRFAILSMAFAVFATGCFTALLAIYVRDALGAGAAVYGWFGTLLAAGTLAGSVLVGTFARIKDPESWLGAGLCSVGGFIALLAAFPGRAVAMSSFFGIGVGAAVAMTACATLLQGRTPDEMRGRVSSVSSSLMSMAQGAAILTAGGAGARMGVRPLYALSALLLLSLPAFRYCRR